MQKFLTLSILSTKFQKRFRLTIVSLSLCSLSAYGQLYVTKHGCDSLKTINLFVPDSFASITYSLSDGSISQSGNLITYSVTETGPHEITYKITNEFGCTHSDGVSVYIEECPFYSFWVPNTFTPNSDDINTFWYPKYENIEIEYVEIYNRWGELIYDQEKPWDGGGAQQDVYVCKVAYITPTEQKLFIGRVNVIR